MATLTLGKSAKGPVPAHVFILLVDVVLAAALVLELYAAVIAVSAAPVAIWVQ
jgi:hypothetical protein